MYLHSQGVSDYGIPKWNEYEVLKYLKSEYRCGTIEDARLSQLPLSYSSLVLVVSFVAIVVGVILFRLKRKRLSFSSDSGILLGRIGDSSNTTLSHPNVNDGVGEVLSKYTYVDRSSSLNSRKPTHDYSRLHSESKADSNADVNV